VSDDEDTEVVSATLISFDVEATEATDTPAGVWSAELRPNTSDAKNSSGEPQYMDNALTRLPSLIAADILTMVTSHIIIVPVEAFVLRLFTRAFRYRYGLPVADLHNINPFSGWNAMSIAGYVGLEMVLLAVEAEGWGLMVGLTEVYRGCEPDWGFFKVVREYLNRDKKTKE